MTSPDAAASRATYRWQRTLLPVMVLVLIGLTIVFVVVSLRAYGRLSLVLSERQDVQIDSLLGLKPGDGAVMKGLDGVRLHALVGLEAHAMEHRYRQASLVMLTRAWTRYLGFLTGMVLAMVGAVFILGKLQESVSKLEAGEGEHGRLVFESASPGLFLALFGTILMALSIWLSVDVSLRDSAVYVVPLMGVPATSVPVPDTSSADDFIKNSRPIIKPPS